VPVELVLNTAILVEVAAARRRGLTNGGRAILALSDAGAPTEPVPRHGVHLTETGFTRVEPGVEVDTVAIGYRAFWALRQHEDLTYNHPHGGHAKFLSGGLVEGETAALEIVAESIRAVLGA
jgi:hypothetical protein